MTTQKRILKEANEKLETLNLISSMNLPEGARALVLSRLGRQFHSVNITFKSWQDIAEWLKQAPLVHTCNQVSERSAPYWTATELPLKRNYSHKTHADSVGLYVKATFTNGKACPSGSLKCFIKVCDELICVHLVPLGMRLPSVISMQTRGNFRTQFTVTYNIIESKENRHVGMRKTISLDHKCSPHTFYKWVDSLG